MGIRDLQTPAANPVRAQAQERSVPQRSQLERRPSRAMRKGLASARAVSAPGKTAVFSATMLEHPHLLAPFAEQLSELACAASVPNVFYEPWILLPSLKAFGQVRSFRLILIFMKQPGAESLLCGFFPLELVSRLGGLPVRVARLWNYLHFRWCPPLIRTGFENECLQAFFAWARSKDNPASWIEFCSLPTDGILSQSLIDTLNREGLPRYITELHTRALLLKADTPESSIGAALPGIKIKELRRLQRRLAEQGELVYEQLTEASDISDWIGGFLSLEASGWKGRAGTALTCSREQREFFTEAVHGAFRSKKLMMLRLRIGNRPIAYKCNFVSEPGVFAFKIAYDEEYGVFSPGVQLELENIRRFHNMPEVNWMDSCADANHFMANHLWASRRTIQTTLIAPRRNGLLLSLLPFLKWINHSLKSFVAGARGGAQWAH